MGALIVILGIVLMVVIHEGAHFVAAKSFGMKATEAFFGFGPRLWSIKRGETEYGVKAVPLGGYVKIIGMNPFEEVDPGDEGRTYRSNPFWKKSVVVLAGIASHFVVALLLFYFVIVMFGVPRSTTAIGRVCPAIVRSVNVADAMPFDFSDPEERCSITAIDGIPVEEWTGTTKQPGESTEIVIESEDGLLTVQTTDWLEPTAALLSGAAVGDRIVEFDGVAVEEWGDFQRAAVVAPGKAVEIIVEREGSLLTLQAELGTIVREGVATGFFGITQQGLIDEYGPLNAIPQAGSQMVEAIVASVEGLGLLVSNFGDLLGAAVSGGEAPKEARPISPVGLAAIANEGPMEFGLQLVAYVNIFVGILNFVPMYPLDGGHFAVALYEKIRGRSADVRRMIPIAIVVFVFVLVLGVLGFYFDFVDPIQLTVRLLQ